jgi:hypothetical protein
MTHRAISCSEHATHIKIEFNMLVAQFCQNGLEVDEADVLANFYLDSLYGYPWQDRVQAVLDAG